MLSIADVFTLALFQVLFHYSILTEQDCHLGVPRLQIIFVAGKLCKEKDDNIDWVLSR